MGEIADMMLDGTLDSVTGEYLGPPCGYPRTTDKRSFHPGLGSSKRTACPICGRRVKTE